ncbi:G1 family glutamic endopeptidase [Bradyrhizobium sp. CCBAU 45384]|uniref:G1 family glutamic endopeptidase n=1 Tax=Bradyrhizobium sp. CCBAU 45384 TaxID=858428 RepID=UPI002306CC70|nr:G1 family glutamic endopeptidase [Bradyrhizobium sp. CCBAU 45384]
MSARASGVEQHMLPTREELNASLRRQILLPPPPPPKDFDALKADVRELEFFRLPPKPPLAAGRRAETLWVKLLSKPLEVLPLIYPGSATDFRVNRGRLGSGYPGRHETSFNWSGACIAATEGTQFTQMWGAWQVPKPTAPSPAPGDYRCSTWIGIDGHRRFDNSLPQMGTTQKIVVANDGSVGPPSAEAWVQWWFRGDRDTGPWMLPNFPLQPEDYVRCVLTVISQDHVRFFIKNETQGGKSLSVDLLAPTLPILYPGGSPVEFPARGVTAEWVTERPTILHSTDLYRLPDYGMATFDDCFALAGTGGIGYQLQDLENARLIKMIEIRDNPHRIAPLSKPEKLDEHTLRTRFVG